MIFPQGLATNKIRHRQKKNNSMWGYVNLKPGIPIKKKPTLKPTPPPELDVANAAWIHKNKEPPVGAFSRKEKRGKYIDYKNPACKAALYAAVASWISSMDAGVSDEKNSDLVGYAFPEATTRRKIQEAQSSAEGDSGDSDNKPKSGILSKEKRVLLSEKSEAIDLINNGVSRAEIISLIMQMSGMSNPKHADNRYDYLIRAGKLPNLKNCGRVVSEQATTTKISQIKLDQKLRF